MSSAKFIPYLHLTFFHHRNCCCYFHFSFPIFLFIYLFIYSVIENCYSDIFSWQIYLYWNFPCAFPSLFCLIFYIHLYFHFDSIVLLLLEKNKLLSKWRKATKERKYYKKTFSSGNLFPFLRFYINFSSRDCFIHMCTFYFYIFSVVSWMDGCCPTQHEEWKSKSVENINRREKKNVDSFDISQVKGSRSMLIYNLIELIAIFIVQILQNNSKYKLRCVLGWVMNVMLVDSI